MFNKKLKLCIMAACLTLAMSASAFATTLGPAGELLGNNHFENGVSFPWVESETAPAHADWNVSDGKYNMTITNNGIDKWDVQFHHKGLTIEQGHTYTVEFTIESPVDCKIYAKIGEIGGAYTEYWHNNNNQWYPYEVKAGVPLVVKENFTMLKPTTKTAEFSFHLAGSLYFGIMPHKISFSNIHLTDPQYPGRLMPEPEPSNAIRVNQIGYAPTLNKVATLVSTSTTPVDWSLKNSEGIVVKTGKSVVKGFDHASGDNVHTIDFSSYTVPGKGYKLSVPNSAVDLKLTTVADSMSFDIGTDLYTTMKYDAIKYFYHNRSDVAIEMPYADRADLVRPVGHALDVVATDKTGYYGAWYTPDYSKDLTGGWYDAGDNGKYVINGGISTWTMYNEYERALYRNNANVAPFKDGTMNIPESGNKIPDILDEARYNTELLLKMQVTPSESAEYAGMVHHKAGDVVWSPIPTRPDQDKLERVLKAPTTAATLNMAAVAAQASRLWKQYDATFATKCITAATAAWDAAIIHPAIYAPMAQGLAGYSIEGVEDEFYWAACELYITTKDVKYLNYIKASPHYLRMPSALTGGEDLGVSGAFDLNRVQGLGTISLAMVPNELTATDVAIAKANIAKAADVFIATENKEGYGSPIVESPRVGAEYEWGSNSFVINQAIVMGYAYDFTKNLKYLNGAATAMDYLLGRNPNVQSYVTGYGENPLENPQHRFWAYQADNTFPKPPAGVLSGGPNSGLQDPWVEGMGWKTGTRPAQKCFMDNIESWSTNEVAINWNAPLAWMASFMDQNIGATPNVPTAPQGLTTLLTPTQRSVRLVWSQSTDNVGVVGYEIYNGSTLVGSSTITDYIVRGLTEKTAYSFTVKAKNVDQNLSAASNTLNVTTRANGDVNGDSKINILDYVFMKSYLTYKPLILPGVFDSHILDINGDNNMDFADYDSLKKILLKK